MLAPASARAASPSFYYLDLGASVSVGVQPTTAVPTGQPTSHGYANRLVAYEASRGVVVHLTKLGCPGESLATMLHGPDPCYLPPDTQLSDALAFLRAHRADRVLVSVDMGFNTLNVCFHGRDIDLTCVTPVLKTLRSQLTTLMSALTGAAGSRTFFIGLNHYNPYLTKALKEGAAETFATNSVTALHRMNAVFGSVYSQFHAATADVVETFHEEDTHLVHLAGVKEKVPANVAYACRYTWMCRPRPFGPNIHPTDQGYAAIAAAIEKVLPTGF